MSDVNCVILPDLGGGAANGAAEEHGTPVSGFRPLSRRFEPLEQSPLVMKPFVPGKRMSPCAIRNNGHVELQTWGERKLRQRHMVAELGQFKECILPRQVSGSKSPQW